MRTSLLMVLFAGRDGHSSTVDDQQLSFRLVRDWNHFLWLVNAPDETEGEFVLSLNREMSQEKETLLNNFHIGF